MGSILSTLVQGSPRKIHGAVLGLLLLLPMVAPLSAAAIQEKMGKHVYQANKWLGSQSEGQWLLS